jgi:hypothetical protein
MLEVLRVEVRVKLSPHARKRMEQRFKPPLTEKDIAEALRRGKMCQVFGGFYVKHGNVGLILKSRLTLEADYCVTTVFNLERVKQAKTLRPLQKTPYKKVIVI